MDYEGAMATAKGIASKIDQPAWVCTEPEQHKRGQFFVVCMSYTVFDEHYNVGNCVAVVLPDGRALVTR